MFLVYGSRDLELVEVKDIIDCKMGLKFELRYSEYFGGDYFLYGFPGKESVSVQVNYHEEDGEYLMSEHQQFSVLIYVNDTNRMQVFRDHLDNIDAFSLLSVSE